MVFEQMLDVGSADGWYRWWLVVGQRVLVSLLEKTIAYKKVAGNKTRLLKNVVAEERDHRKGRWLSQVE